jgi:predicted ATPase
MENILSNLAMLGRDEEEARLRKKLDALRQGQGGALLLHSRYEFAQNLLVRAVLREEKIAQVHGVCQPHPFVSPYGVLRQNFPAFFADFSKQTTGFASELLRPFSNTLYQGTTGMIMRRTSRRKSKMPAFTYAPENLHILFARFLAQQKLPAVVCIEDVHWAEMATFKLLKFVIPALRHKPVLFILTAVPDLSDTPDLPLELRGSNIPVMQKLKAMQLAGRFALSGKSRRDMIDELCALPEIESMEFAPVPARVFIAGLKKVIGQNLLAEPFLERLAQLAQGNTVLLHQVLLYLLDRFLVKQGKHWQLNCEPYDIKLPGNSESLLAANLEKLPATVCAALKQAAVFGMAVPLVLWQQVMHADGEFAQILETCVGRGILQIYGNDTVIFNSHQERQVILQQFTSDEEKRAHSAWLSVLSQGSADHIRLAFHGKQSEHPETALEHLFEAGQLAESLFAYEEAYDFYREAARSFPDCLDVCGGVLERLREVVPLVDWGKQWQKLRRRIRKWRGEQVEADAPVPNAQKISRRQQLAQYVPQFLEGIALYRIAALVKGEAMMSKRSKRLMRRLVYGDNPARFFVSLGNLIMYLAKTGQLDKKAYPQSDITCLGEVVMRDLLPHRDYACRTFFAREIYQIAAVPAKSRMTIARIYEKWGDALIGREAEEGATHYLCAAFFARESGDFYHAARILHKLVDFCQKNFHGNSALRHVQVEALRCLGKAYEKWAARDRAGQTEEAKDKDSHIRFAIQVTAAYRDAAKLLWESKDASWLPQHLMEKAYEICESYLLENGPILESLKTAKIKRSHKAEEEYSGKAVIVADSDDGGSIDLVEESLLQEKLSADIVTTPAQFDMSKIASYACAIFIVATNAAAWKNLHARLRAWAALADGKEWKLGTGWFIEEQGGRKCFLLLAPNPAELYQVTRDFCTEKILRRYL